MSKDYLQEIVEKLETGPLPGKIGAQMKQFYLSYIDVLDQEGRGREITHELFPVYYKLVIDQIKAPYQFELYHKRVLEPYDHYRFGIELFKGITDVKNSSAHGLDIADGIVEQVKRGENVILFANHQTEADPQVMSILLEKTHPLIAEEMILVAGERVVKDPMAIPFSMGTNLLCIYSKRYMDLPGEDREERQLHNRRTMRVMASLLTEGGKIVYVAPSGGRDRPDENGVVHVAPFDGKSVEMFRLMAVHAKKPAHFYPLALSSYNLLPPPSVLGKEIGEARFTRGGAIQLAFGEEIDMDNIPGCDMLDKHQKRAVRADYAWNLVDALYQKLPKDH